VTDYAVILRAIEPKARPSILEGFAAALPACIELAGLSTSLRFAHFLAQTSEESAGLHTTVEYASGHAYEGRRDLGNTHLGDGPRFKGRGLIQLTGRFNYAAYGKALKLDLLDCPEQAAEFPTAALIAAEYWKERGLNRFADHDDICALTLRVNGGENGLSNRKRYLARAKKALLQQKAA
jgi:putative chitinase